MHIGSKRLVSRVPCTTCRTCSNNIANDYYNARRKILKNKLINDQRSIHDYFTQVKEIAKQDDEIESDDLEITVNVQWLIDQLVSAKVILKRLPDSLLKHYTPKKKIRTKRYCPICKVTTVGNQRSTCRDCNSFLKYVCAKCGAKYSKLSGIKYHQKIQCFVQQINYRCLECDYSSTRKYRLENHVRNIHVNSPRRKSFLCSKCRHEFSYFWELSRHGRVCKGKKNSELLAPLVATPSQEPAPIRPIIPTEERRLHPRKQVLTPREELKSAFWFNVA